MAPSKEAPDVQARKAKWQGPLAAITMLLVSSCVGLFLAEALVSRMSPKPPANTISGRSVTLKEYAPNGDFVIRPVLKSLAEIKDYRVRTDKNGYIIGPDDVPHINKRMNILFVGGSTTECLYVDEELRFPYLVSQMLTAMDGSRIHTRNGGFSGAHTLHSFISIIAKGIAQKPEYIVITHNINDFTLLTKSGSYWIAPATRQLVRDAAVPEEHSLVGLLRYAKDLFFPNLWRLARRAARPAADVPLDEWAEFRDNPVQADAGEKFLAAMKSLVGTVRAWGIQPVLMTEFSRLNLGDQDARRLYEAQPHSLPWQEAVAFAQEFNQKIRSIAAREDILLIDLARELEGTRDISCDLAHFNAAGSKRAAEIIATALVAHYLAPILIEPAKLSGKCAA